MPPTGQRASHESQVCAPRLLNALPQSLGKSCNRDSELTWLSAGESTGLWLPFTATCTVWAVVGANVS